MIEKKTATRRIGTVALAALLVVSMVGASGLAAAKSGMNGHDDGDNANDGDSVFSGPLTVSYMGITITVGPPTDPDGDGVYDDVTGDGDVNLLDAVVHAAVVTAVDRGVVDLTDDQTEALDVNGDDELNYKDTFALAQMTFPGAMK